MIEKKKYLFFILYGLLGIGKMIIVKFFFDKFMLDIYFFNVLIDNKVKLKDILDMIVYYDVFIIVDEIYCMKIDI